MWSVTPHLLCVCMTEPCGPSAASHADAASCHSCVCTSVATCVLIRRDKDGKTKKAAGTRHQPLRSSWGKTRQRRRKRWRLTEPTGDVWKTIWGICEEVTELLMKQEEKESNPSDVFSRIKVHIFNFIFRNQNNWAGDCRTQEVATGGTMGLKSRIIKQHKSFLWKTQQDLLKGADWFKPILNRFYVLTNPKTWCFLLQQEVPTCFQKHQIRQSCWFHPHSTSKEIKQMFNIVGNNCSWQRVAW